MHAPFCATISTGNTGLLQRLNHGFDLSLRHCGLNKWIALAIEELGTEFHYRAPCLLHTLHEQLPMHLAIVL